jgi:hypothetical protein
MPGGIEAHRRFDVVPRIRDRVLEVGDRTIGELMARDVLCRLDRIEVGRHRDPFLRA